MSRRTETGFPKPKEVEGQLVILIYQNGGSIQTSSYDWNVYDEMADRCRLSQWARTRRTSGDPRPAWRAYVGYRRKTLLLNRFLDHSRDGIWALNEAGRARAERLLGR